MKFFSTSVFLRSRSRCASARFTLHAADLGLLRGEPGARHRDRAVRGVEVGARLVDAQLEGLRVDARDDLVLLHLRVEVGVDLLHLAGDLRADLHGGDRVQRAARRHHRLQRRRAPP